MRKLAIGIVLTLSFPALAQAPAAGPGKAKAPAAVAAAPAAAAAAPATPPGPPKMSPEGRKLLDSFIGNWSAKDPVFKMGDKEMKGKMSMKCEKAANGWATLCKGKVDMGAVKFDGLYTFAWDLATGEGHLLEVDDSGAVHNHAGKWTDDKSISLVHTGKNMEGKSETDTVTFTWASPKELTFAASGKSGATTNWTFNAVMKK